MFSRPPNHPEPAPGQESVWDYPRPPRLEPVAEPIRVVFAGRPIVDTIGAFRVLETSHPPTYYLPPGDIADDCLQSATKRSFCEWKGAATYLDVVVGDRRAPEAAWTYHTPPGAFAALAGYVALYAHAMDECRVGDHLVDAQAGSFYGGWITPNIIGPFKGPPGTLLW